MKWQYKVEHSLAERVAECDRIRSKYPYRLPVIVERYTKVRFPNMDQKKFLVPRDFTVGQFYFIVRQRIRLEPESALFLLVGSAIPPASAMMGTVYEQHCDNQDGFLYMAITDETIYGGE